jgi:hypothetical protein
MNRIDLRISRYENLLSAECHSKLDASYVRYVSDCSGPSVFSIADTLGIADRYRRNHIDLQCIAEKAAAYEGS